MNTPASSPGGNGSDTRRSPEQLREEADRTREQLSESLDQLQSRLSPRARMEAMRRSTRERMRRLGVIAERAVLPGITTMIRVDHSHVLAIFRRFRPGISESKQRALVRNACLALEVHAQLEEEIFYPALREAAGPSEVLDKSVPEHEQMRSLIRELRVRSPEETGYEELFRKLIRVVLHHVADEETVLLPLSEELLADQLGELGLQMTRRRVELLRPDWREVAASTARTFPVASAALAMGVLAIAWLALRPRRD